jgi:hypothetical protein
MIARRWRQRWMAGTARRERVDIEGANGTDA